MNDKHLEKLISIEHRITSIEASVGAMRKIGWAAITGLIGATLANVIQFLSRIP